MKSNITTRQTISLFWKFTKPYKRSFGLSVSLSAIAAFTQNILPSLIIAHAFNRLQQANTSNINLGEFWPYLIAFAGLHLTSVLLWRIQTYFTWAFQVRGIRDAAVEIFDRLQHLGATFHANHFGGALVSQANKFLIAYERTSDELVWSITNSTAMYLTALVILFTLVPLYAVAFLIVSVMYGIVMYKRTVKTMPLDRDLSSSESDRTAKLADTITNVSAVTSFAGETHEKELFSKQAQTTHNKQFKLLSKVMVNDSISHSIINLMDVLAFSAGVAAITIFHSPAGILYLAVNYTGQLVDRLWEARRTLRNLNRSFGDATDMTHILYLEPEIKDHSEAKQLVATQGVIDFNKVTFTYPERPDHLLFEKLSLHIESGKKIGLVGHSGGGKTSLTKILLRLIDLQDGQIAIDGQNIAEVTQTSLRQAIAYVPQEPALFHRSIADNIRYGNPKASFEEVVRVSKLAHADEFVRELPDGYETLVGERGVKLSGGQRQRIAIARAMLKDAPILLLDEATSALDSESEVLIQDALWKLMEGRTAIVIAHRLSTIQKMDRIIVMEDGKIVEEGTHRELIRQNGEYAKLWAHQSGGFLED